jgi:cyclic pyranopterin phosphate synthase
MLDSYNREINYLRISVTDRCNLRCIYCMPASGIRRMRHDEILSFEEIIAIVREASRLGVSKIRITGGEPLVRKNICSLIRSLKAVSGIREVSLTTNGVLLSGLAEEIRSAGLDRINISLDSIDPERYRVITRIGDIRDALRGIDAALAAGFAWIKINMVLLPGLERSEVVEMERFCRQRGLELQRINHYSLNRPKATRPHYEAERPLACTACNRIRLTADGKLKACLFSNTEFPVDRSDIRGSLERTIRNKPRKGFFCTNRQNWQIGG